MVIGSSGKKKPNQSANSMAPLKGVSVRATTHAKKSARTVVIAILTVAKLNVLARTGSKARSPKALIHPCKPQTVGCPGRLRAKLLRKIRTTG